MLTKEEMWIRKKNGKRYKWISERGRKGNEKEWEEGMKRGLEKIRKRKMK